MTGIEIGKKVVITAGPNYMGKEGKVVGTTTDNSLYKVRVGF